MINKGKNKLCIRHIVNSKYIHRINIHTRIHMQAYSQCKKYSYSRKI